MNTGLLIVFSAPSGAGKTTIINALLKRFPEKFIYSVSSTTRPLRGKEVDGIDYYFLPLKEFQAKIKNEEFIEWARVHDYYYGTAKKNIEQQLASGKKIILDLDVKGALAVKEMYPTKSLLIFIAPVSTEILIQRLKNRATESDSQITRRLERLPLEMKKSCFYDHVIINDILENSIAKVEELINIFQIPENTK